MYSVDEIISLMQLVLGNFIAVSVFDGYDYTLFSNEKLMKTCKDPIGSWKMLNFFRLMFF